MVGPACLKILSWRGAGVLFMGGIVCRSGLTSADTYTNQAVVCPHTPILVRLQVAGRAARALRRRRPREPW